MMIPRGRSGFALLMVLVLVMLAAVALAALARASLTGALQAHDAVQAMQRRWAVRSVERTLLSRAETLLDQAERGRDERGDPAETYQNPPMQALRITCDLVGGRYDLVITDEQAKMNVNRLFPLPKSVSLTEALRPLSSGPHLKDRRTRFNPRPLKLSKTLVSGSVHLPTIRSYGQLFEAPDPATLVGHADTPSLVQHVTCWGDGQVNLRRASAEVIMAACERRIGRRAARLLVDAREEDPYRPLSEVLASADRIDADLRPAIRQYVTDRSTTFGLWVVAWQGDRAHYYFKVQSEEPVPPIPGSPASGNPKVTRTYTYVW